MTTELRNRLRKILELANGGVGGEMDNAKAMLKQLMQQHGLSESDLQDEPAALYSFNYRGKHEKELLAGVIFRVLRVSNINWSVGKTKVHIKLRRVQFNRIDWMWGVIRHAWKKELKATTKAMEFAFYVKHSLGNPDMTGLQGEPIDLSPEELAKIRQLYRTMEAVPLSEQLTDAV